MVKRQSMPTVAISVVVATYQRVAGIQALLQDLAAQVVDVPYEVIVVDDGTTPPVAPQLSGYDIAHLTLLYQENAGPAVARDYGIGHARGEVIVLLDDDMRVGPDFLAAHLRVHQGGAHVVLGHIANATALANMPLFERFHAYQLNRFVEQCKSGALVCSGVHVCSGNVSFRRALYQEVGGFNQALDRSEDRDLGLKFERRGARFVFCAEAESRHESDHQDLRVWLNRAIRYGRADSQIAPSYPNIKNGSPWFFYRQIHKVSQWVVLLPLCWPSSAMPVSGVVMGICQFCAKQGWEKAAISGTTLAYGIGYFAGVREAHGSLWQTLKSWWRYERRWRRGQKALGLWEHMLDACMHIAADHAMLWHYEQKYHGEKIPQGFWQMGRDAVQKIGFQMMCMVRLMQSSHRAGISVLPKVISRCIRHLYGADIHWEAKMAPGVVIIHGMGLVVSHSAEVAKGCILFHGVTLGEGIDADTRKVGAPRLGENVHVGPGSSLIGPIEIGAGTKIAAGSVLTLSVGPKSRVYPGHTEIKSSDAI